MIINHIALIPDGNRRWAKKKGFPSSTGHYAGAKTMKRIFKKAFKMGIKNFTVWVSSTDNLKKRPKEEIMALFKIYKDYFLELLKAKIIVKNGIKINVFGKWNLFCPADLKEIIKKVIKKTRENKNYLFNILLAYDGIEELLEAIKKIKKIKSKVNFDLLRKKVWTGTLPSVDLIIRTGVEDDPHNSGAFMSLHTAYSQYYFTKTLFPDLSEEEFERAVNEFLQRERRFGK
ncbi:MAG: polyprenyl diphosphate synthase [Minisyncoccales bacterium]